MDRDISANSLYIEKTLQHLLLAQLSQMLWRNRKGKLLEIATAEIDNKGFDVVLTLGYVTRHVQLKCLKLRGKRAHIDVNVGLGAKPRGSVLLCEYDPQTLEFVQFRFFGNPPGKRLARINQFPVAANPRGKTLRKNVRKIPKKFFTPVVTTEHVIEKLFGISVVEERQRMIALSLRQPNAEEVLRGTKKIEYRSMPTSKRERVYVYASQTPANQGAWKKTRLKPGSLPTGVLVGTVEIIGCEYKRGEYYWHLASPKRFARPRKPKKHPQPSWFYPF